MPIEVALGRDGDRFVGHDVGRYRIDARIGEEAWARAYAAHHQRSGRKVVVRILHPKLAANKSHVVAFVEHARKAQTARHPHVVTLLEADVTAQGHPFWVSDALRDETLEAVLRSGPLSPARAATFARQILSGLLAVHDESGIVHGSLSPSSIRIVTDEHGERAEVDDFGFSALPPSVLERSRLAHVLRYAAPERLAEPGGFDVRADIYAVGATLYAMLAGVAPFVNVDADDLARVIVEQEPRKLRDLRPELRVSLVKIVNRAMRKAPEERYATLTEMLDALAPIAQEPEGIAASTSVSSRPPPPRTSTEPPAMPRDSVPVRMSPESSSAAAPAHVLDRPVEVPKPPRSRYAAAALALVLGLAGIALWRGTSTPPPRVERSETTSAVTPVEVKNAEVKNAVPVETSTAARVSPGPATAAPPAPVVRATPTARPRSRPAPSPQQATTMPSTPTLPPSPASPTLTQSAQGSVETPALGRGAAPAPPPTPSSPARKVRTSADIVPYLYE